LLPLALDERARFAEPRLAEERFWPFDPPPEDRDAEELWRFFPPAFWPEPVDPDWPAFPKPMFEPTFSKIPLGSSFSSFTLSTALDTPRTTGGPVTTARAPPSPTATGT
jgi:hypothetical protein